MKIFTTFNGSICIAYLLIFKCIIVGAQNLSPSTPTNLQISVSGSSFTLQWQDKSSNETGFKIERKSSGSSYELIGTTAANAISYVDSNIPNLAVYTYRIYAFNSSGVSAYSSEVSISLVLQPYNGYPILTTGILEAEQFDFGGEGLAYHDQEGQNLGNSFRSEGADIEPCSEGGHNISYIKSGEWMTYTVSVPFDGPYSLSIRVASAVATGKFHIEFDGVDKTGIVSVPNTNGWQNWTTLKTNVQLNTGKRIMRVYADGSDFNINNFSFNSAPQVTISTPATTYNTPATIQLNADAFDANGTITKVEFYVGSTLLGTSTTSPYQFQWNTSTAGSYSVKAVAYDNLGLAGTSASIAILVNPSALNLALNKPIYASTIESSSLSQNFANDGNYTTRWSSTYADPQYIVVDLGATYNISRVKITWETAYGKNYQIQFSNNNSTWSTATTVNNNTSLVNNITGLSGTARYVKMYGYARGTNYGYSIYELEVYGTSAGRIADTEVKNILAESIYPNPAKNFTQIDFSDVDLNKEVEVNILDQNQSVRKKLVKKQNETSLLIDTEDLSNGFYFIAMKNGSTLKVKKLIVDK
jgi:hypothetical protein